MNAPLWRQATFVRFFVGACLSVIGNWFNNVAIAILTYRLTGQVSLVALALAGSVLPRVLLSPIGGVLADRFERRGILVALDSLRAIVALLPLLAHDEHTLWAIYAGVILLQVGACIYNPAQNAYVPALVPDDLLESANAVFASMRDVGMFAGPAIATLILGLWGTSAAFLGNALSFAVSAGLLLTLPRAATRATNAAGVRAIFADYKRIVGKYPHIAALFGCYVASSLLVYFFLAIMVAYARVLAQPTTFVGDLYAAAGLGGACGGLAMGTYLRRLPYGIAVVIYAASVPLIGALAFVHSAGLALVLFACSTAAGTAGDVIITVNVQRRVHSAERGRAFGLLFWCIALGQLAGAMLGTTVTLGTLLPSLVWVSAGVFPVVLAGVLLSVRTQHAHVATHPGAMVEGAG